MKHIYIYISYIHTFHGGVVVLLGHKVPLFRVFSLIVFYESVRRGRKPASFLQFLVVFSVHEMQWHTNVCTGIGRTDTDHVNAWTWQAWFAHALLHNGLGQYPLVNSHCHGISSFLIGKPSRNGSFVPWWCWIIQWCLNWTQGLGVPRFAHYRYGSEAFGWGCFQRRMRYIYHETWDKL